jgi:hypothetical protein
MIDLQKLRICRPFHIREGSNILTAEERRNIISALIDDHEIKDILLNEEPYKQPPVNEGSSEASDI